MKTALVVLLAALMTQTALAQRSDGAQPAATVLTAAASLPESPSAVATSSSRVADAGVLAIEPAIRPAVVTPRRSSEVSVPPMRTWMALAALQHGAAVFDAWSTRRAVRSGARELNPLVRPVANSNAVYPALQLMPLATDFVSLKMMHSRNRVVRRGGWLPQTVGIAGSTISGFINLGHYYPPASRP